MNSATRFKVIGGWVVLALIGLASIAWLQPRLLSGAHDELNALQRRLNRAEDGAAEIRNLVAELTELKNSAKHIKHVPQDSQFADLNKELSNRLERLGITDREITNGGSVELGQARSIPMRIRMTSGFLGIFETIEWIESLPRLIRVQRVQMKSTNPDNPWEGQVEVEITLDAVFDPDAKAGGELPVLTEVDPEASRS